MSKKLRSQVRSVDRHAVPGRNTYRIILLVVVFVLLFLLMGFVFLPVEVPAWVPYTIHSILAADYSADSPQVAFTGLKLDLIYEAIQDRGTPIAQGSQSIIPTLLGGLVPTITPYESSTIATPTQWLSTAAPSQPPPEIISPTPVMTVRWTATNTLAPILTVTSQSTPIATSVMPTFTSVPRYTSTPTQNIPATSTTGATQTTSSPVVTHTPTITRTPTPSRTPTRTPTPTLTRTPTLVPSATFTNTPRPSSTPPPPPTRTPRPYPEPPTATSDPYP